MLNFAKPLLATALIVGAAPLSAEVTKAEDGHFITIDQAIVEADRKATWLALIDPAKWWNSSHTFTGDSANLRLTPQAGGCFCETVPEIDEPDRFTLEGSVEHMRVVNSQPEVALRMRGSLGPLQSEPVTGVLTIALTEVEVEGKKATRIVWEYNVGGAMRYDVGAISKAVDGVMTQQLNGLAESLGRLDAKGGEAGEGAADADPEAGDEESAPEESTPEESADKPTIERESVEDAFGDLEGNG